MTEQLLLTAIEKRFDDRLDGLETLLDQSVKAIRELYETKIDNLETKIDNLQDSFSSKEKEAKSNRFTLWLTIIGWFVTSIVAIISWIHSVTTSGNAWY